MQMILQIKFSVQRQTFISELSSPNSPSATFYFNQSLGYTADYFCGSTACQPTAILNVYITISAVLLNKLIDLTIYNTVARVLMNSFVIRNALFCPFTLSL